jgi:alpha-amylase/alpha-mannosidase (GH57 family)
VSDIAWGLVLNLHQPSGNIEDLLDAEPWEAKEILWAMDRIPRSLWGYEDVGRVHLSVSGTLLETLTRPGFQERVYGVVDCGSLLWHLQNTELIDILGTGYYHPVLPLIPPSDWDDHLERWKGMASHLFHRTKFQGFWPPEMGFSMELIPHLARMGYRYVLVDSEHVRPVGTMSWEEVRYRPHIARFGGAEIVVVVRDRDLSNAQESGMEIEWFLGEVASRTAHCDFPALITTATDGENGGWFRNTGHNFWNQFYVPLMDRVRAGTSGGFHPEFIHDYLNRVGVHGEVTVGPGAWNTGWHHGHGFVQWTGSEAQREMLTRVGELSQAVQAGRRNANAHGAGNAEAFRLLDEAHWRVLRAETSCNFFWGEAWVERCESDLNEAGHYLHLAAEAYRS